MSRDYKGDPIAAMKPKAGPPRPKPYSAAEDILARLVANFRGTGIIEGDLGADANLKNEIAEWIANELWATDDLHLKRLLKDRNEHGSPMED